MRLIMHRPILALLLAAAAPAAAHDAQRLKLTAWVQIAAPPAKIWAIIGHFHDLSWDPLVARTEGQGGDTPDRATRTTTLKSGGVLPAEELTRYDAATYTYATFLPHVDVKTLPVTNYSSILAILPQPDGGSRVEWRSAFYRGYPNFNPPPELNETAAIHAVTALTQPALDALKQRLEAEPPEPHA